MSRELRALLLIAFIFAVGFVGYQVLFGDGLGESRRSQAGHDRKGRQTDHHPGSRTLHPSDSAPHRALLVKK